MLLGAAAKLGLTTSEYVWIAMSAHVSHAAKKAFGQQQQLSANGALGGHDRLRDAGPLPNGLVGVTYELTQNVPLQAIDEAAVVWAEGIVAYAYEALAPHFARGADQSELRARLRDAFAFTRAPLTSSSSSSSSSSTSAEQRRKESSQVAFIAGTRVKDAQCNLSTENMPLLKHPKVLFELLLERLVAHQSALRATTASGDLEFDLRHRVDNLTTTSNTPSISIAKRDEKEMTANAQSLGDALPQPEELNASLAAAAAAALSSDIDGLLMRSRFNFYNRKNNAWSFVRRRNN